MRRKVDFRQVESLHPFRCRHGGFRAHVRIVWSVSDIAAQPSGSPDKLQGLQHHGRTVTRPDIVDDLQAIISRLTQAAQRDPVLAHPLLYKLVGAGGVTRAHLIHGIATDNGKRLAPQTVFGLEQDRLVSGLLDEACRAQSRRPGTDDCYFERRFRAGHRNYTLLNRNARYRTRDRICNRLRVSIFG